MGIYGSETPPTLQPRRKNTMTNTGRDRAKIKADSSFKLPLTSFTRRAAVRSDAVLYILQIPNRAIEMSFYQLIANPERYNICVYILQSRRLGSDVVSRSFSENIYYNWITAYHGIFIVHDFRSPKNDSLVRMTCYFVNPPANCGNVLSYSSRT